MPHIVTAHTPLGPDQLRFRAMQGHEGVSQLFEFDVELVSPSFSLDLKQLLGQALTLEIETRDGGRRYLSGLIARCALAGRESATGRHYVYRATVRPWLWYLTQTSDSKIFQNRAVPDVLDEVLGEYGFTVEKRLTGSYRQWEYCVQYQETDFAFVSRLMEHEGIYYWFEHAQGKHTLVLCDDAAQHAPCDGYASIPFYGADRATVPQEEYVSAWETAETITPGGFATLDYDFKKPAASLDARRHNPAPYTQGNLEVYEWLGGYTESDQAELYARLRLEALQSRKEEVAGLANVRGMAPGRLFTLRNHPRQAENRQYLVLSASYRLHDGGDASGTPGDSLFEVGFTVLPASQQYRAPRLAPLPHTHGPQTARVVGPAGEQIWTDQYGRVKVQFHWDRYGQRNQNSSCWVRVSSPWAGGGFGGIQLPRVNDEVIVDFIGGHPDRPIVIGRVYNAGNMPPWDLPANATQSGFLSRSKDGTPGNANALMFEDKPGIERIWLHAERDLCTEVELNEQHLVDGFRNTVIGSNDTTTIGGNRSIAVTGTDLLTVGMTRHVTVTGFENYTVNNGRALIVNGGLTTEHYAQGLETTVASAGETRTVIGLFTETLHNGETRYVKNKSYVNILSGGEERHVNDRFEETITGPRTITVTGGDSLVDVDGALKQKSSGQLTLHSTGSGLEVRAQGLIKIISEGGNVEMEGEHVKQKARASDWKIAPQAKEIIYFGKFSLGGAKTDIWLTTFAAQGAKTDATGSKVDIAGISNKLMGAEKQLKAVSLSQVGVKTLIAGLTALL